METCSVETLQESENVSKKNTNAVIDINNTGIAYHLLWLRQHSTPMDCAAYKCRGAKMSSCSIIMGFPKGPAQKVPCSVPSK